VPPDAVPEAKVTAGTQVPSLWTILSSLAGTAGATFAAAALLLNARRTQRSETFQHLRDVNEALARLGPVDARELQAAVLAYMRHEGDAPERWAEYQAMLDTLELLAFAVEQGAANQRIARAYLRSFLGGHLVPAEFLRAYQAVTRNRHGYESLLRFVDRTGPVLPPMIGYPD
jgi:recombinational DNA repair protein (RecF pathway)